MAIEDKLVLHTKDDEILKTNIRLVNPFRDEKYSGTLAMGVFSQLRVNAEFSSHAVTRGLLAIGPTINKKTIANREELIKTFIADYKGDKSLLKHLQIIHLAGETYELRASERVSGLELLKNNGLVLERCYREADLFFNKLKNTHKDIAQNYQDSISRATLETNIRASAAGGYNFLLTSVNCLRGLDVIGVMDNKLYPEAIADIDKLPVAFDDLEDTHLMTTNTVEFYDLMDKTGVFVALYAEALSAITRENNGKSYCFAKISNKQHFSMLEGEPLVEVVGERIPTTIQSNEKYMRMILSGLHSGGKSILLQSIPEYILNGMSGKILPAREVTIPFIDEIIYSLEVKKDRYSPEGGKLEIELNERADTISRLNKSKLYVCDEFLQHASPDAAEYLEPTILEEIEKTCAAAIIVTHRGELIDENKWQYFHPQFREEQGVIIPNFQFDKGRPDDTTMQKHAEQLLNKIMNRKEVKESYKSSTFRMETSAEVQAYYTNKKKFFDIVVSGGYTL